ncbi:hypothetical protein ARMGADRAFT_47261 [Armillaria gallica]|uniref:Uncharacterized protein n=1 Tax=Armillaria gallica TaxID=47427 RepID=A0A2H3EA02_ARMGA|nr:hypothetical protein ARMGADRAFT_47261 [Armillaria gallica]
MTCSSAVLKMPPAKRAVRRDVGMLFFVYRLGTPTWVPNMMSFLGNNIQHDHGLPRCYGSLIIRPIQATMATSNPQNTDIHPKTPVQACDGRRIFHHRKLVLQSERVWYAQSLKMGVGTVISVWNFFLKGTSWIFFVLVQISVLLCDNRGVCIFTWSIQVHGTSISVTPSKSLFTLFRHWSIPKTGIPYWICVKRQVRVLGVKSSVSTVYLRFDNNVYDGG